MKALLRALLTPSPQKLSHSLPYLTEKESLFRLDHDGFGAKSIGILYEILPVHPNDIESQRQDIVQKLVESLPMGSRLFFQYVNVPAMQPPLPDMQAGVLQTLHQRRQEHINALENAETGTPPNVNKNLRVLIGVVLPYEKDPEAAEISALQAQEACDKIFWVSDFHD